MARGWWGRWGGCDVVFCTPLLPCGLLTLFRSQRPRFPLFGLDPLSCFVAFRKYIAHFSFNFLLFLGLAFFAFIVNE